MPFFEDREIVLESESPDGRWRLTVLAPTATEGEDTYFAEFEQSDQRRATGIPFGPAAASGEVTVDWHTGGDSQIAGVCIDEGCFALFCWREGFVHPREEFRHGDEAPFTEQEIDELTGRKKS